MKSASLVCLLVLLAAAAGHAEPSRPKILGVSHMAVWVSDVEKSRAFYKDFLGFAEPFSLTNADGSLNLTFIKINDDQFLELFTGLKTNQDRLHQIAYIVNDDEAMRAHLAASSVKVPDRVPKGRIGNLNFSVKDPDGHNVEFVQYAPDGWTRSEQGRFLPETRISQRLRHVGFLVGDLAAAKKFYGDLLGFTETWRGSRDTNALSWVNMKVPDGDDYVEFMLYSALPVPDARGTTNHLCLEVADVQQAKQQLEARSYRQRYTRPLEVRTGINRRRQLNLYDPDGTRVELMEPSTVDGQPVPSSTAPPPLPVPAGAALLAPDLRALQPGGKNAADVRVTLVSVSGQPFNEALQVETLKRPPYPWNITLAAPTIGAILKGDVLLATATARRVKSRQETGEALIELIVEENDPEHHKLLEFATSVAPDWTPLRAPFVADKDYPAGAAQFSMRFGYQPQTIEVAAVGLTNYGAQVAMDRLPRTLARYAGWETNAPWRQAAAERIEKIRKGDLLVEVVDAQGRPVPDAKVAVRMLRHEFAFGTAIMANLITSQGNPDLDRYRETIEKYFNKVVFENELKWQRWNTNRSGWQQNRTNVFATIEWLKARHIAIRGHVMIWPSWENTPGWLREFESQPDKLRAAIDAHFADQTSVLKGWLDEWDVINESYAHNDVVKVLGREEMARWFKLAHQGDPSVRLFYNDYIMFAGGGEDSPSQYFFDTIKFFKEQSAPIGGIGEQGHFGGSPPSPQKVLATFDRFQALGLPIQISEFDIDTSDEELKTHYTRDFMTACFSHPAVSGVMMWGFWEGAHWRPRAALWNKDWTLRPNGQVWLDLVTREWWTSTEGATDQRGTFKARGFCGDYEITVQAASKVVTRHCHLSNADLKLRLEVK